MSKRFKKILLIVMVIAMATVLFGSTVFADRDMVGDLNRDGVKDENDAIHLLNNSLFGSEWANGAYYIDQPSDYNNDGMVDEQDAIYLLNNILFNELFGTFHICDYPDNWEVVEMVNPTCKDEGYTLVKCTGCEKTEKILRTAKTSVHTFDWENSEITTTKAPTCLENGIETVTCTVCGEGTETREIEAIGHDYRGGNCETGATCFNCGDTLAAEGHKYPTEPTTIFEASCKPGYKRYECTAEGCDSFIEETIAATKEHSAPADAWSKVSENPVAGENCTFELIESAICECGEAITRSTKFTKHNEVVEVVPATCVKDGYRRIYCSECGDEFKYETIARPTNKAEIAHTWNEGVVDGNVTTFTCTTEGCGETKTTVAATEDGKVDIGAAEEVVLNNGAAIVPDDNLKEEFGGKDVSVKVDVVDTTKDLGLSEENKKKLEELGDAKVYDFSMMVGDENVTEFGEKNGEKLAMTVRIPYELVAGDDPDCILIWYIDENGDVTSFTAKYVDGYAVFTTTHFSYYTVVRMTPEERCAYYKSHNFERTVVPATCVTGGYTLDVCTRCGHRETSNETEALGHVWDVKTLESTCTVAGRTVKTCKACEIVHTELGTALGHKMSETPVETVAPTCTAKGKNVYRCTNDGCEYFTVEEIAQLGHEYTTTTVDPTCVVAGYTSTKCQRCGDESVTVIAALGHEYVDSICVRCNTECAHEFEYGVCKYCDKVKEKPVIPEVCKHPTLIVTYEFLNADKKLCSEGVKITESCADCDYKYTFTRFECYTWHVDVDLSAYDVCKSHSLSYTTCACGQSLKFDGINITEIFESGKDYAVFGCSECALYYRQKLVFSEDSCDGYYRQNDFYVGDKLILEADQFVNTPTHDVVTTYEFVNKDQPYCTNGVIVTETCKKCGNVETYTENKCVMHYVEVALPETGHCGAHYLNYFTCPCGLEWDFAYESDINLDKEFVVEGEDPDNVVGFACENADCGIYAIVKRTEIKNGCAVSYVVTYSFYCGDKLIHEMRFVDPVSADHVIEYSYEFANKDLPMCQYGVYITETCKYCSYTRTYATTECVEWLVEVDLSGFDTCGRHNISYRTCPCGNSLEWVDENSIYLDVFIDPVTGEPVVDMESLNEYNYGLGCKECGLKAILTVNMEETECFARGERVITFCFGDTTIAKVTMCEVEIDHSFADMEFILDGKSCEDGFTMKATCRVCGESLEYKFFDHYDLVIEKVDLSKYGACDSHGLSVYTCPCGENVNVHVTGLQTMPQLEGDNVLTYYCHECKIRVDVTTVFGAPDENCEVERIRTFELIVNEKVVETFVDIDTSTEHRYVILDVVLKGDSCDDGVTITYVCSQCGHRYTRTSYGHNYQTRYPDLSEYNICETHNIEIWECVHCGKIENIFYRMDGKVISEETENGWYTACPKCSLVIIDVISTGSVEGCMVEEIIQTFLYSGDVLIFESETRGFYNTHEWETKIEFADATLGCEGGVIRTDTCTKCGEVRERHYEGHMWREFEVDLQHYGACGHHYAYGTYCETCELIQYMDIGNFDGCQETENGDMFFCNECGMTISRVNSFGAKDENCGVRVDTTYIICVNKEEVRRFEGSNTEYYHNIKESYTFIGKDCLDGVLVSISCADCGESFGEHTTYSHSYVSEEIDISAYGACESHTLTQRVCVVCDARTHLELEGGKIREQYINETTTLAFCKTCGIEMLREVVVTGDMNEHCEIPLEFRYTVSINGEVIKTATGVGAQTAHDLSVEYVRYGKTCEDGYLMIVTCSVCGLREESEHSGHNMVYNAVYLSEFGACEHHWIEEYVCEVCGFGTCELYNTDYVENKVGKIYTCKECGLNGQITKREGADLGNCTFEVHYVASISVNGTNVYSKRGSGTETRHTFETSFELLGETCEDGVKVTQYCTGCGTSDYYFTNGHEFERVQIDLSAYTTCKEHVVEANMCRICGKYDSFRINGGEVLYSPKFDENGEVISAREWCRSCGIEILYSFVYGEPNENCMVETYTYCELYIDGNHVASSSSDRGMSERHSWQTTYELINEALGCEGGVRANNVCVNCGMERSDEFFGHQTISSERYDLVDYGHKCESGSIYINSCLCGKERHVAYNLDNFDITERYDTVDDVSHFIQTYTCLNCKYTIMRDAYSMKDEYCNAVYHESWTFGGMTIGCERIEGRAHNEEEKLLTNESYVVNNPDGTRTEVNAYERYCKDCKASLVKYVYNYTYNANGELIKELIENYEYKAFYDEIGGTVALLSHSNYREYFIATSFDGKYTTTLPLLEIITYYHEGVETGWDRREYRYNGTDYCTYEILCSNHNGESWTESSSGNHSGIRTRYELSKGSTSCLDGLDRIRFCELCGTEIGRTENVVSKTHRLDPKNSDPINTVDFTKFGAVCEGALRIYACPCGEKMRAEIESTCDFGVMHTGKTDENGIYHSYVVRSCAVSECGFKFVEETWNSSDANCKEIFHCVYYLGVNETNDAFVDSFAYSYYTGQINHAETDTTTFIDNNRYYESTACTNCGKLESTIEIEKGIRTEIRYYYHENGNLSRKHIRSSIASDDWHSIPLLNRNEYFDESGEKWTDWQQSEYVYPDAASGNYCIATVTHSSMSGEKNETSTVDNHSWSCQAHCTPAIVTMSCDKCGATREELNYFYGHNFYFNGDKGCFVCNWCGLESQTDGNGSVGFEDKTAELGNGEEYVIGWYNNYKGDHTWVLELLDTATGKLYELNLELQEVNDYTLVLNANAVKSIANGYGLSDCGYMIVITFVPTDSGELDYSITLDPHVYTLVSLSTPTGGCTSKEPYVWTYKCNLCGDTYEETRNGHKFEGGKVSGSQISVAADGTITKITTNKRVCVNCGEERNNVYTYVYGPNGRLVKEENVNNGKISGSYEYTYDYANDLYTYTYRSETSHTSEEIIVRRISTDEIISQKYTYKDGRVEDIRYTYVDGIGYKTYSYNKYSDGNWEESSTIFDFDNGTYTITYLDSYGNRTVEVRFISDGRLVSERIENADGSTSSTVCDYEKDILAYESTSTNSWTVKFTSVSVLSTGIRISEDRIFSDGSEEHHTYAEANGIVYESYYKYVSADGKWQEIHSTADAENDVVISVTTNSDSATTSTTKRKLSTGEVIYEETVNEDGSKNITEYDYDKNLYTSTFVSIDGMVSVSAFSISPWEHLYNEVKFSDGRWYKTTFTLDEANDRKTETTVNSEGTTTVEVYTISNYNLVSRDITYKDGSWERTTVVDDETLGKRIETTENSKGFYHLLESDLQTYFVTLEIRREEDGSYMEVRNTIINGGTQSRTTYQKNVNADGDTYVHEWMLRGEETYVIFDSFESASNGYKRVSEYSYDFDNDVRTETRTEGDTVTVTKTKISTGEFIA